MSRSSGGSRGSRSGPRYTLEQFHSREELGAGSFGTVKRVVNSETGEVFAMKVLEKERVKRKKLEEQLKREVLTQIRVKHQNVVRLHYYFEDANRIYCLLEFAERGTLFSFMKDLGRGVPEVQAAQLFGDSADGIQYLHGLQVVHRDLKPENILLYGSKPTAKIGDFGWCVELTAEEPERKTFCGTMEYLAPEMLTDEPHDFSVDLWALGVLLFETILGRAPFEGGSHRDQVKKILSVQYVLPPHFPEGAAEIVKGLLVFRKEKRTPLAEVLRHPWIVEHRETAPSPTADEADTGASAGGCLGGLEETQVVVRNGKAALEVVGNSAAPSAKVADGEVDDRTCIVQRQQPAALASKEATSHIDGEVDDRTCIVQRQPPAELAKAAASKTNGYPPTAQPPVVQLDTGGTSDFLSAGSGSGRPEGTGGTNSIAGGGTGRMPSASPRESPVGTGGSVGGVTKTRSNASSSPPPSESPLPDLLSSVRDAGHLRDLDDRLLGAPQGKLPARPVANSPISPHSLSSIDLGPSPSQRFGDISSAPAQSPSSSPAPAQSPRSSPAPAQSPSSSPALAQALGGSPAPAAQSLGSIPCCDANGLVTTRVVSDVPRPKALSRRSQPSTGNVGKY